MRRLGVHEKSDERILGRGEFVEQLIKESDQTRQEQFFDKERLHRVAKHVENILIRILARSNSFLKTLSSRKLGLVC